MRNERQTRKRQWCNQQTKAAYETPWFGFSRNGDSEYDQKKRHKLEVYKEAGIERLFLTRDSLRGDWPTSIMGQIEDILKQRLDRFYRR